jgi:8-oxo-dGTP diphosphatase
MSKVTHYVCGLLFSPSLDSVVLIRKNRPTRQAGKLNGVGGKVEANESPSQAMVREFREETGVEFKYWNHFAKLSGTDFQVWFYCGSSARAHDCATQTDEAIELHPAYDFYALAQRRECVENLPWLVSLAQQCQWYPGQNIFARITHSRTDQAKEGAE